MNAYFDALTNLTYSICQEFLLQHFEFELSVLNWLYACIVQDLHLNSYELRNRYVLVLYCYSSVSGEIEDGVCIPKILAVSMRKVNAFPTLDIQYPFLF